MNSPHFVKKICIPWVLFQRKWKNVFKKLKLFLNFQQFRHGYRQKYVSAYWQGTKVQESDILKLYEKIILYSY